MTAVSAWPTWVLSNHDNARVATRLGGDQARARAALVLLLTLRGTAFLYAGEELGLEDALISPDQVVDPGGRDGCRAPLPWTRGSDHGWAVEPWLPFAVNAAVRSVESQRSDERSTLRLTKSLLELRHDRDALRKGDLEATHVEGDLLVFDRVVDGERIRVVVNFSRVDCPFIVDGTIVLSSAGEANPGVIRGSEALVIELRTT